MISKIPLANPLTSPDFLIVSSVFSGSLVTSAANCEVVPVDWIPFLTKIFLTSLNYLKGS